MSELPKPLTLAPHFSQFLTSASPTENFSSFSRALGRINKIKHFQSSLINVLFDSEGGLNNSAEECSFVSRLRELPAGCTRWRVRPGRAQGARVGQAVAGAAPGVSLCSSHLESGGALSAFPPLAAFFFLIDFYMMAFADHKCHSLASCSLCS